MNISVYFMVSLNEMRIRVFIDLKLKKKINKYYNK